MEAAEKDYTGKTAVTAANADAALTFLGEGETITMTPEDEKRLVRKIDMRIVPLMC